jgi:hypothetical protein
MEWYSSWLEGHTSPTLTQGHLLRKEIAVFRAGLGFLRSLGCSFCRILVLVPPHGAMPSWEKKMRDVESLTPQYLDSISPKATEKLRSNQEKLRVT